MRILVIGGYGLIGSYVLARLHAEGHEVVGLGREVAAAERRFAFAHWIKGDLSHMTRIADWTRALAGFDAVVNCAGALQDSPRDDLRAVHVEACRALYGACAANGPRRVVHMSAAGVGPDRPTAFNATKLEAEQVVRSLDLDWVILRPGLVLAPAAYGGTALLRGLAGFAGVIPISNPDAVVQVVSVEDVALAVARALQPTAPSRLSIDLAHPEPTSLADIVLALRRWLGFPAARLVRIPAGLAARLADAIAWLGWRSPMRTTSLAQLNNGVTGEPGAGLNPLGVSLKSLDEILAGWPSGVQERWFARLYFMKPAALVVLIAFWFASGLIGLTTGFGAAVKVLSSTGVTSGAAKLTVAGGSVIDMALALAACLRSMAPRALQGMVLVSAAYLAGGTFLRPDLWLDPLGPYAKILPGALLALTTLAVMDER